MRQIAVKGIACESIPCLLCQLGSYIVSLGVMSSVVVLQLNWYTKRVSVAGVYKSSELFMLQDTSDDFRDTWSFMQRRVNNVMKLGEVAAQVRV